MSGKKDESLLNGLTSQVAKWLEERQPIRMQEIGVDEAEDNRSLDMETDHWVKYNTEQRG